MADLKREQEKAAWIAKTYGKKHKYTETMNEWVEKVKKQGNNPTPKNPKGK